jgi:hypothetical protein
MTAINRQRTWRLEEDVETTVVATAVEVAAAALAAVSSRVAVVAAVDKEAACKLVSFASYVEKKGTPS